MSAAIARATLSSAALSWAVSWPPSRAPSSSVENAFLAWNGAASSAARRLGESLGRKSAFDPLIALDSGGRAVGMMITAAIHAARTTQRKRTITRAHHAKARSTVLSGIVCLGAATGVHCREPTRRARVPAITQAHGRGYRRAP